MRVAQAMVAQSVSPESTQEMVGRTADATLWLAGLRSSGKTTIVGALASRLRAIHCPCEVLDGNVVRQHLGQEIGYGRDDRDANVRRIGCAARLLATHCIMAIAAIISPYSTAREAVRAYHSVRGVAFLEVHLATAISVRMERDIEGLYARTRVGLSPRVPELRIDTASRNRSKCRSRTGVDSVAGLTSTNRSI